MTPCPGLPCAWGRAYVRDEVWSLLWLICLGPLECSTRQQPWRGEAVFLPITQGSGGGDITHLLLSMDLRAGVRGAWWAWGRLGSEREEAPRHRLAQAPPLSLGRWQRPRRKHCPLRRMQDVAWRLGPSEQGDRAWCAVVPAMGARLGGGGTAAPCSRRSIREFRKSAEICQGSILKNKAHETDAKPPFAVG